MHIHVETKILTGVIRKLRPFIAGRSAIPVIKSVSIEANGSVMVEATNLDQAAGFEIDALVIEEGRVVVGVTELAKAIKATKSPKLKLTSSDDGGVDLLGTAGTQLHLAGFSPEDYPAFPEPSEEALALGGYFDELGEALAACAVAASKDNQRPILQAISLEGGPGGISVTATDSYRLAAIKVRTGGLEGDPVLVPAIPTVKAWQSVNPTTILADERRLFLIGDDGLASIRYTDGTFPQWRTLMPKRTRDWCWEFTAGELKEQLAYPIAAHDHIPVRIDLDTAEIRTTFEGAVDWSATMVGEVNAEAVTGSHKLAYTPRYLSDLADMFGKDTKVRAWPADEGDTALKPITFTPAKKARLSDRDLTSLLMPVRV